MEDFPICLQPDFKTALCATVLLATPAAARTLMVGPGQPYSVPSAAVAAAHAGDTISIAAGTYSDCSSIWINNLTIAGAGGALTKIGGTSCDGKGVLVVYGNNITVRDLTLQNASVPDQNGAGLRAEGTNLVVARVHFIHNQDGILADGVTGSTIMVRDSLFVDNGYCGSSGQNCAHALYANGVAKLTVEHSTFRDTQTGHNIKSRAAITEVLDNTIDDGPKGTSSYLIDAPNGGALTVQGNHMEKGPLSGNPVAISIGEEGVTWPAAPLLITDNVFRNDFGSATFVSNTTSVSAKLVGNTMEGNHTTPLHGPGTVQ